MSVLGYQARLTPDSDRRWLILVAVVAVWMT